jgi:hypothetical protein
MTTLEENIKALNTLITSDNTLKAIDLFYAENVIMQENEDAPRVGKQVCIDHEKKNLDKVKSFKLTILNQAIDALNQVVFNEYYIEFETLKGMKLSMKEVSVQHWENGQIIKEKFYFKTTTPVQ